MLDHDVTDTSRVRTHQRAGILPVIRKACEHRKPEIPAQPSRVVGKTLREELGISRRETDDHLVPPRDERSEILPDKRLEFCVLVPSERRDHRHKPITAFFDPSFGYAACDSPMVVALAGQHNVLADIDFGVIDHSLPLEAREIVLAA